MDERKKLQRQIGWLNHVSELAKPISCSDVIDVLLQLDLQQSTYILRCCESNAASINDPTSYILAAAKRAGADAGAHGWGDGGDKAAWSYGDDWKDPTGKIAKQVGWLNSHAGLQGKLSFSDVVGPLSALDVTAAMKILKDLEGASGHVGNPTSYVLAAAARLGERGASGGSGGGGWSSGGSWTPALDPTGKIARQVGWLNRNADLNDSISFKSVVEPLSRIDVTAAMGILKDLEEAAATVEKPTAYVMAAAQRLTHDGNQDRRRPRKREWDTAAAVQSGEEAKKVSRTVGWLNQHGSLAEPICYSDVSGVLSELEAAAALKILKSLEERASEVMNPTAYITAAARRAGASGAGAGGGHGARQERKYRRVEDADRRGEDEDAGKRISRQVGKLNKQGALAARISYEDVKGPLESCGVEAALRILRDLEHSGARINDPQNYILVAASKKLGNRNKINKAPSDPPACKWTAKSKTAVEKDLDDKLNAPLDELANGA